jgi:YegS/Rv2252/BmrU family lipid kinase
MPVTFSAFEGTRRCTLIANPASGSFCRSRLDGAVAFLREHGVDAQVLLTGGPGDASRLARQLCEGEAEPCIVAVGGDGTTHEVINGIGDAAALLAVLPAGTSNVLARELGIRGHEDALARIVAGSTRPLFLGSLELGGEERRFFLMAGMGFDGEVVEKVDLGLKRRFAQGAYVVSAFARLLCWDGRRFPLEVDGRQLSAHGLIVCNAARYGGDFVLAPEASPFGEGLVAVVFTGATRGHYLRTTLRCLAGRSVAGAGVELVPVRRQLRLEGDKAIQADGDFMGHGPAVVRPLQSRIRLVV